MTSAVGAERLSDVSHVQEWKILFFLPVGLSESSFALLLEQSPNTIDLLSGVLSKF